MVSKLTCCQFWLKSTSSHFFFHAMPILADTPATWRALAKRWRKSSRGRLASDLTIEERRESLRARAAFWSSQASRFGPDQPQPIGCRCCGVLTFGWCEGCYARVGEASGGAFNAVCKRCDQDRLVCDQCQESNHAWAEGQAAYQAARGGQGDEDYTIEISANPADPPQRLDLRVLAAEMGCTAEELREQLLETLGTSSASSS